MKYSLTIRKHNEKAHLDIEADMQQKKDGLFTFILRVNNGNIVDYNIMEVIDGDKYAGLEQIIIKELTNAYNPTEGSGGNGVRSNNIQRGAKGRTSATQDT